MHCTKRYGPNCGNHLLRTSSAANVGADEDSDARRGEGLGHQVVEGLALLEPGLELGGHALQLGVAHLDEVVLDGVDRLGDRLQLTQDLAFADAEQSVENRRHCY